MHSHAPEGGTEWSGSGWAGPLTAVAVAVCQSKRIEGQRERKRKNWLEKSAPEGFHWSLMKSKLQFGHVAASLPLSPSRRKSRLVQRPKVHLHPQLLDRCSMVQSLSQSHPQHWGFHPAQLVPFCLCCCPPVVCSCTVVKQETLD